MFTLIVLALIVVLMLIQMMSLAMASPADRVAEASRHVGWTARQLGLPRSLWCADFMNLVERRIGLAGTGSRLAMSFASYGRRLPGSAVDAIATMSRRGGGHVGVVTDFDTRSVTVISGNHGPTVSESTYPISRIRTFTE